MADKKSFRELVGESIGEASMAWSSKPKGVFDSAKASELIDRICAAAEVEPRECKVCGNQVPLPKLEPMPHPDSPTVIVPEPPPTLEEAKLGKPDASGAFTITEVSDAG